MFSAIIYIIMQIPSCLTKISRYMPSPLYIVGGYTRDAILGAPANKYQDIDLCGKAGFEEVKKALNGHATLIPVNAHTGTFLILTGGKKFEYTPFRSEKYTGGGHTPCEVDIGVDLYTDCMRRDFTCNAVYYEISSGKFADLCGGIDDIKARRLKLVDGGNTLKNDGLRIMRLARFASKLGMTPDEECIREAAARVENLKDISRERILKELEMIFELQDSFSALEILADINAFKYILGTSLRVDKLVLSSHRPCSLTKLIFDALTAGGDYCGMSDRGAAVCRSLKMSNNERQIVCAVLSAVEAVFYPVGNIRAYIADRWKYKNGILPMLEAVGAVILECSLEAKAILEHMSIIESSGLPTTVAAMSVKAADLKTRYGFPDSSLGVHLKALRDAALNEGISKREDLLKIADRIFALNKGEQGK